MLYNKNMVNLASRNKRYKVIGCASIGALTGLCFGALFGGLPGVVVGLLVGTAIGALMGILCIC